MSKFTRNPKGFGNIHKMSGKRRNPYEVRVQLEKRFDPVKEKVITKYYIVGYAATRNEAKKMLINFNKNPVIMTPESKMTFAEIYEEFKKETPQIFESKSKAKYYDLAFRSLESLHDQRFGDLNAGDLERAFVVSNKNYPSLRKMRNLLNQMYKYAIKNEIADRNWAEYINMDRFYGKNPNSFKRKVFTKENIDAFWRGKDDIYYQVLLIMIYTGVRVSELLDLKKEDIDLDKHCFNVIKSKTENGIRTVPIADCIYPFFENWYYSDQECEYLIHTPVGKHFKYQNYYDAYFLPIMETFKLDQTPHCCRHTCISLLAEAKVDQTTIKKIVGHSGAMSLTERVYTHLDVQILIDAVNQMYLPEKDPASLGETL